MSDEGSFRYVEHWQDSTGQAKDLGVVWVLRKGAHEARCVLQGHPLGIEARVLVDGEVIATKAFRDRDRSSKAMIDETWEWRKAFEAKGWGGTE
jgi:hypothetical protein